MNLKRGIALLLSILLLSLFNPIALAIDDDGLEIGVSNVPVLDSGPPSTDEGTMYVATPPCEAPPPFFARIVHSRGAYQVIGHFSDFPPDVIEIQSMYSLDGESYQPMEEASYPWDMRIFYRDGKAFRKEEQTCMTGQEEPLKSYLTGSLTQFYLKLELTRENGETYCTQAVKLDRNEIKPLPKDAKIQMRYAANMRNGRPSYGKYNITVAEGTTWSQVHTLLPRMIPMEVQIFLPDAEAAPILGTVEASVEWKLPNGSAADHELTDAAIVTTMPDQMVTTPLGVYQLKGAPEFDTKYAVNKLHLIPNVVSKDAEPMGVLSKNYNHHLACDVIEMAFDLKPTGATGIHVYSFLEGGDKWVELPDIPLLESVENQPRLANTDYVTVLRDGQGLYEEWQGGKVDRFWIGAKIEGGVYDGKSMVLAWPEEYDLPPNAPDVGGSGGNKGDVGSDGVGNDDSSNNGGQRPNLPSGGENSSNSNVSNDDPLLPAQLEIKPPTPPTNAVATPEAPPKTPVVVQEVEPTNSSSEPPATPDDSDTAGEILTEKEDAFVPLEPISELKASGVSPIVPVAVTTLLLSGLAVAVGTSSASGAGWLSWLKNLFRARL